MKTNKALLGILTILTGLLTLSSICFGLCDGIILIPPTAGHMEGCTPVANEGYEPYHYFINNNQLRWTWGGGTCPTDCDPRGPWYLFFREVVVKSTPLNNAVNLDPNNVTLTWYLPWSSSVQYSVVLSTWDADENDIFYEMFDHISDTSFKLSGLKPSTTYHWTVTADTLDGNDHWWGGYYWTFTTTTQSNVDGTTVKGNGVFVQPKDSASGTAPVEISFHEVTSPGVTTLTISGGGTQPPSGLKIGDPPTYFEIDTTATFSGPVTICIDYSNIIFKSGNAPQLLHWNEGEKKWENVTLTPVHTSEKLICGQVTSFSPFIVAEPHPTADAGLDLTIFRESQEQAVVQGFAAPAAGSEGGSLNFRWLERENVLTPWSPVGTDGEAPLNLGSVPPLSVGKHTLILEVTDGVLTDADTVIVTVDNSAPVPAFSGWGVAVFVLLIVGSAALAFQRRRHGVRTG